MHNLFMKIAIFIAVIYIIIVSFVSSYDIIYPMNDTRALSWLPNNNYYLDTDITIGNYYNTPQAVTYMSFDISSLPYYVNDVQICIYGHITGGSGQGCNDVTFSTGVYRVKTNNFDYSQLTWNNQPCGSNLNNSTNCELTPEDIVSKIGYNTTTGVNDYIGEYTCYNVTNMYIIEKSQNNILTVLLRGISTNSECNIGFYSKESSVNKPYMIIYYPSVTPTTTLPYSINASISQISVSDNTPTIGQEIRIRVKITNTGQTPWNFPVGISIGKNGVYCNRDCYVDGKGDYVYTGNIHSGQTVEVERVFKFRDEYFDYGQSYDLLVGVYAYPYMPPSQAYDYKVLSNYFTIVPLEQKLDAFPISVKASKSKVAKDDYIDITSYILNNGSIPYNFTIGMSIGIWDTNTGVFKNYKTPLLPPCNTECYIDDKGDWIYAIIPPNYTDPIKRSFKIPDYFLDDNPFDVAIGIYTDKPENGGKLISISYFKNVSKTTTEPSMTQQLAGHAKSAIDAFIIMSSTAFGVPISGAKILFVVFIESLVVYLVFRYNQTGVDNRIVILSLVMLMTFAFTAIGWFPLILAILVILVCGLILYSIIRG